MKLKNLCNLRGLFVWDPGWDKKRDGTTFLSPLYVDIFNRDETTKCDGMISYKLTYLY